VEFLGKFQIPGFEKEPAPRDPMGPPWNNPVLSQQFLKSPQSWPWKLPPKLKTQGLTHQVITLPPEVPMSEIGKKEKVSGR